MGFPGGGGMDGQMGGPFPNYAAQPQPHQQQQYVAAMAGAGWPYPQQVSNLSDSLASLRREDVMCVAIREESWLGVSHGGERDKWGGGGGGVKCCFGKRKVSRDGRYRDQTPCRSSTPVHNHQFPNHSCVQDGTVVNPPPLTNAGYGVSAGTGGRAVIPEVHVSDPHPLDHDEEHGGVPRAGQARWRWRRTVRPAPTSRSFAALCNLELGLLLSGSDVPKARYSGCVCVRERHRSPPKRMGIAARACSGVCDARR